MNLITAAGATVPLTKAGAWVEPSTSIVHGSYSEVLALQQGEQIQVLLQSTSIASNPWQETDRASLLELEIYVDGEHDYER